MADFEFDESDYLAAYPDVARAVLNGEILSGRQHYLSFGRAEGRASYRFDLVWYGATYPSAREEVRSGKAKSLKHHYETLGRRNNYLPHPADPAVPNSIDSAILESFPADLVPIMVTHIPRSGSTFLMDMLLVNPGVSVASHYPYEVRVATYYAHAHHVLTSLGDHRRSSSPTEFMRDQFSLSYNPFNHPEFHDIFTSVGKTAHYFDGHVKARTYQFFRQLALDFYKLVAADQGKLQASHFAEKCELNYRFRSVFRKLFPETKEIILVRDLRDIYCSYRRYFQTSTIEQATSVIASAGRMLLTIKEVDQAAIQFVRYEDCVVDPIPTVKRLSDGLGIHLEIGKRPDQARLFEKHATSASPEASIGRWRSELVGNEREIFYRACASHLPQYNDVFGYTT